MSNSSKIQGFSLDGIITSVRQFLRGNYTAWCKLISFKGFRSFDDPLFGEIESPEMKIIGDSFVHFQSIAAELKNYVEEIYESESEQQKDLLISELLAIKGQLDALSSEDSVTAILNAINYEAEKYFIKNVDFIDEETGEIVTIKKFSRKTAYINPNDFDIYRMYFRIAIRELSSRLETYCNHLRETRMAADERYAMLASAEEQINKFIQSQKKELANLHGKLKKSNVVKCFSLILYGCVSHRDAVDEWLKKLYKVLIDKEAIHPLNEKPDVSLTYFKGIFIQNQKVYHKIPWKKSNAALNLFISLLQPYLGKESIEKPYAIAVLCFERYGKAESSYGDSSEPIRNPKGKPSKKDTSILNTIFDSLPAIPKNPHPPQPRKKS